MWSASCNTFAAMGCSCNKLAPNMLATQPSMTASHSRTSQVTILGVVTHNACSNRILGRFEKVIGELDTLILLRPFHNVQHNSVQPLRHAHCRSAHPVENMHSTRSLFAY